MAIFVIYREPTCDRNKGCGSYSSRHAVFLLPSRRDDFGSSQEIVREIIISTWGNGTNTRPFQQRSRNGEQRKNRKCISHKWWESKLIIIAVMIGIITLQPFPLLLGIDEFQMKRLTAIPRPYLSLKLLFWKTNYLKAQNEFFTIGIIIQSKYQINSYQGAGQPGMTWRSLERIDPEIMEETSRDTFAFFEVFILQSSSRIRMQIKWNQPSDSNNGEKRTRVWQNNLSIRAIFSLYLKFEQRTLSLGMSSSCSPLWP